MAYSRTTSTHRPHGAPPAAKPASGLSRTSAGGAARGSRRAADGYSSDEWAGARHQRSTQRANVTGGSANGAQKENRARHGGGPRAASKLAAQPPRAGEAGPDEEEQEGHPSPGAPYDAADDILDIDRRLNALQQFLATAKAPR